MPLPRLSLAFASALLVLGLGATAAQAAPAYASSPVNVRAGAGTNHAVLDVLSPGERVDVDYCLGTWCFVTRPGPDGWVSASYLSADRYDEDDFYDDDDFYVSERPRLRYRPFYPNYRSQFCWGGPGASFCFRD